MRLRLIEGAAANIDKLPAAMEQQQAQQRAAATRAAAAGFARDKANRDAANAPLPPLYQPKQVDIPQAPKQHPRPPEMAIANPLSLLAVVGGLFAKTSTNAALNALSGAIEGQAKGDQQAFENEMATFHAELQRATQSAREEHTKYAEAWDNRKKTWDERVAKLQMLTTQYGNTAMRSALGSGNAAAIQNQLDMQLGVLGAIDKLTKTAGGGAHGLPAIKEKVYNDMVANGVPPEEALRRVEQKGGLTFEQRLELEDRKAAGKIDLATKRGATAKELEEMKAQYREERDKSRYQFKDEELRQQLENKLKVAELRGADQKEIAQINNEARERLAGLRNEHRLGQLDRRHEQIEQEAKDRGATAKELEEIKEKNREERDRKKALLTAAPELPPGAEDKHGPDFLPYVPPADRQMLINLTSGLILPQDMGWRGATRERWMRMAAQYDPDYSPTNGIEARKFETVYMISGSGGQNFAAYSTAANHLFAYYKALDALDNGNQDSLNYVKNWISQHVAGAPEVTNAETARTILAPEVAKAVRGAGALNKEETDAARQIESLVYSREQTQGSMETLADMLMGRSDSLQALARYHHVKEDRVKQLVPPKVVETFDLIHKFPLTKGKGISKEAVQGTRPAPPPGFE
jgi:hypothetical protein